MNLKKYFFVFLFILTQSFGANHSFIIENDALTGTDRHYTNGLFYTYMHDSAKAPKFLNIKNASQKNQSFSIYQLMFTPEDLSVKEKQLNDIPYAGYIALNYALFQSTKNYFHEMGTSLGSIGPISRTEQVQTKIHKLTGNREPQGWDNQLDNKAMAQIYYQFAIKTKKLKLASFRFDWTNNFRIDRGNFYRGGLVGTSIRIGSDFPDNFYTGGSFFGGNESQLLNFKKSRGFIWYISTGVYFNNIRHFYIVDADHEYELEGIDYVLARHFTITMQYKTFSATLAFRASSIDNLEFKEESLDRWGSLQFNWTF